MFRLLFLFIVLLTNVSFAEDDIDQEEEVNTETLFMDPSLSLDRNYDFVNFQYLSEVPKFVAPKISGGNFKLSDYVGDLETNMKLKRYYERYQDDPRKTLIISFMASYCEPCKDEIPELIEVAETLYSERNDILLVFVGMDGNKDLVNAFIRDQSIELPENAVVLINPPRNKISPSSILKVTKLPSLFVVNRQGELILEHHGYKKESNIQLIVETIVNYYEGIEKYNK